MRSLFACTYLFCFLIQNLEANQNSVKLSKLRLDSLPPYTDVEYLEITGLAGTDLTGLSILVLAEHGVEFAPPGNGGYVSALIPLQGQIPEDRSFILSNSVFFLQQPDQIASPGMLDAQNITVFLLNGIPNVQVGSDLDEDNDGQLDNIDLEIFDSVSVMWQPSGRRGNGGPVYSPHIFGPMGGFIIFGIKRCLDIEEANQWSLLPSHYMAGNENPGELNPPCNGTICSGDFNLDNAVNGEDLGILLGAWGNIDGPYDLNRDGIVSALDLNQFLSYWETGCPD